MVNLKSCLIVTALLAWPVSIMAGDSLNLVSFNSPKWCRLENMWLHTENASGLAFNRKNEFSTFDAGTTSRSGDFHRTMDPSLQNRWFFSASSYQTVNDKFFVGGSFSYDFINESGARWTGTYDPYRGNPYLLADSLTGVETHKEAYRISGQAAWILSDRLILGGGLQYRVSVAAKQKDPRPEINVTFLEFHPSLLLIGNKSKIGFDAGYANRKEEISYTTYKSNFTPAFFMFKGFGFFSKEIDYGFYRFQTSHEGFAGLQFEKNFPNSSSLSEIRGRYGFEKIEDGGSVIIREDGGDWKTWQVDFHQYLKRFSGNKGWSFDGGASWFNGDGVEYTQQVVYVGNNEEYVTIGKNLKFNRQIADGHLNLNYLTLKEDRKINWDLLGGVNVTRSSEKYYYIPEVFTASWLNLTGNATVKKNLYTGSFHFAPSLGVSWRQNLSESLSLSDLPEITIKQRPEIFRHDFDHSVASVLGLHGIMQVGLTPPFGKIGQVNLTYKADYLKPSGQDADFIVHCFTMGFVF